MTIAAVVSLLVGLCLLIFGRKLFWLVGAAVGFVIVIGIAQRFFNESSGTLFLIIAVGAGILGAVLAVFLQKVAIRIAGFVTGGFFLMNVVERFGMDTASYPWVAFLVGGILGLILVSILFEWALILVSSLIGAVLVAHALGLGTAGGSFLVVLLLAAGVLIQARLKKKTVKREPAPAAPKEGGTV